MAQLLGEMQHKWGGKVVVLFEHGQVQQREIATFRSDQICGSSGRDAARGARGTLGDVSLREREWGGFRNACARKQAE